MHNMWICVDCKNDRRRLKISKVFFVPREVLVIQRSIRHGLGNNVKKNSTEIASLPHILTTIFQRPNEADWQIPIDIVDVLMHVSWCINIVLANIMRYDFRTLDGSLVFCVDHRNEYENQDHQNNNTENMFWAEPNCEGKRKHNNTKSEDDWDAHYNDWPNHKEGKTMKKKNKIWKQSNWCAITESADGTQYSFFFFFDHLPFVLYLASELWLLRCSACTFCATLELAWNQPICIFHTILVVLRLYA